MHVVSQEKQNEMMIDNRKSAPELERILASIISGDSTLVLV